MSTFNITITGGRELMEKFSALDTSLLDFTPEMTEIGENLAHFYANDVFNYNGAQYGEAWQPLSEVYATRKAKLWPSAGILQRSRTMQDSFGYTVTPVSVTIYNSADYFKYHQSDQPRKIGKDGNPALPQRLVMAIEETRKEEIGLIMKEGVKKRLEI